MDPKDVSYYVSRLYVHDYAGELPPEIVARLLGWIRSRDLKRLASCSELLSEDFATESCYRHLRQVEAFFKKNALFAEPISCRAAAISAFDSAERQCRITNRRLNHYYTHRERLAPDVRRWMSKAEAFITDVLGDVKDFHEQLPMLVRFTSGATSTRSRRQSYPFLKVTRRMVATPGAFPYIYSLAEWLGYDGITVRPTLHNRVEFVPKNWKTERTIACEPEANLPLQLAFDTYAKERLRHKAGIDLSDQSRNQELARLGSIDGSYATIDLKAASDTVALNTVAWLLPGPWYKYLCDVRTPKGNVKGSERVYAKFSSMGNGATFALETLIFAAACVAVGSKAYSVYGDDIIIETEKVEDLLKMLKFLGFTINASKSFIAGPFRESCGSDWFRGRNITPFYLREWSTRKSVLSHNVNGLARIAYPGKDLWNYAIQVTKEAELQLVPFSEDSTAGVWIDTVSAYHERLIKKRKKFPQQLFVRAYVSRTRNIFSGGLRGLFLWYLDKHRRASPFRDGRPLSLFAWKFISRNIDDWVEVSLIRSWTPVPMHKYARKWVHWHPPVAATPPHLYWWSEDLLA